MTNTAIKVNFYGLKRFETTGKHPSECISEAEEFEETAYDKIELRAKYFAELWEMDCFCIDDNHTFGGTHFYKENFFKWHK